MKRVSIRDIAKEAGVSISTVSRVINNSAYVSPELKRKVLAAVEKLGYRPSGVARSLRKGRTKIIGFIIPDITNPFFPEIVRGAEDYLRKKGYTLILCNSDNDMKQEIKLVETLMEKNVDGLLFTGAGNENPVLEKYIKKGLITVFLDRILEGVNSSYVVVDNKKGMKLLLEFLWRSGHTSYVFINGNKYLFSAVERHEAFIEFVNIHKVKDYKHYFGEFTYEFGYSFGKKIEKLPDVIVCGNDLIAYGVIDALEERGYSIPDDVSITGFDDIFFSRHYKPPLTTVRQPSYKLGYEAAKLLVRMLSSKRKNRKGIVLDVELVVRNSTRERKK